MNPKAKQVFNITDDSEFYGYHCSFFFKCAGLESIPKICPVKGGSGLGNDFSNILIVWINSEPYELRCTPIYNEDGNLVNVLHTAKNVSEQYQKHRDLENINSLLKIIHSINQTIYLEGNPQRILEQSALSLLKFSGFEYILIIPSKVLGIKTDYLEYFSSKFSQTEELTFQLKEQILEAIHSHERKELIFERYHLLSLKIGGSEFKTIILKILHFGENFGYLAIQTAYGKEFLEEEIGLLLELAGDIAFALNFSFVELEKAKLEKELQEKERFYFTLLQNLPGFVYRCRNDRYWTMEYLSDQFYDITGYKPEEVIGNKYISFNDLIHPEHQERLWVKWQEILHKREVFQDEYPIIRKDKQIRWVFEQGRGVFDENGRLLYLEGYIVDVTERKLIEEDLRASERKYRALFESSQDAIFLMLGDTFVDCNYSTYKMFECTRRDIIGRTPYEFSPEYQPDGELSLKKALNYIRRAFNGEVLRFEWTHRTLKGKLFDTEVTLNRFFVGSTPYLVAIVRDISEIKRKRKEFYEFAQVVHSIGEVVTVTDLNNDLIFVNKAFEEIYGYSANEVIGKNISILRPENFDPTDIEELINELNLKGTWRGELINRKKDGSLFPILLTSSIIKDDTGKITGYLGVAKDLSEIKRLEKEVIEANNHLTSILNSFDDIIYLFDTRNICIGVFGKWLQKWGLDKSNIIGKTAFEIFGETSGQIHSEMNAKCINELSTFVFEWEYPTENEIIYYQSRISPYFDCNARLAGIVGVARDISNFKELQRQLEIFYWIANQNPISIIIFDTNGKIKYANERTAHIIGYSKDKLIGKDKVFFKSLFAKSNTYDDFVQFFKKSEIWNTEFSIFNKNGEIIWLSCNAFPIHDSDGNIVSFVFFNEDATFKRNLLNELTEAKEKAEELNALKNYLMMYFSHEFRTPLNVILGYSQLLMLEQKDGETKDISEKIYLSGQRLLTTMNLLFDYSKIETGLLKVEVRYFDFIDLVREISYLYSRYFSEKNINFKIETEFDILEMHSDETMVRTIVANLISNAYKFTKEGEIIVSITRETISGKEFVELVVHDTGIGISSEHIELIWKEFYQVSQGLARQYEGSGIGLTVTKKFVEMLGGQIFCESQPNVGSKFRVLLPVNVEQEVV